PDENRLSNIGAGDSGVRCLPFSKKKGKIPAYDFQQAKQGPRPPVLCWQRFRPVISAREIPTPTLTFGRNFRRRISEAHTPAYKTITLPVSPILSTGPNGILAPPLRERACRRIVQSSRLM